MTATDAYRWCQRETGAAFALNAMIEADRVKLLQGRLDVVDTPSNSGKGQKISRGVAGRQIGPLTSPRLPPMRRAIGVSPAGTRAGDNAREC